MTPRFTWTDADRAKLVPGAVVRVTGLKTVPDGDYEVHRFDPPGGLWILGGDAGVALSFCVDPASIRPPKQLGLFGEEKP